MTTEEQVLQGFPAEFIQVVRDLAESDADDVASYHRERNLLQTGESASYPRELLLGLAAAIRLESWERQNI